MTISKLKTGMRVVVRNGDEYIVMRNCYMNIFSGTVNIMVNIHKSDSWLSFRDYDNETMICKGFPQYDIMQIYIPENASEILSKVKVKNALWFNNIWVRQE